MFNIFKGEIKYQLKSLMFYMFIGIMILYAVTQFQGDVERDKIVTNIEQVNLEGLPTKETEFEFVKEEIIDKIKWEIPTEYLYKYPVGFAKRYEIDSDQKAKMEIILKLVEKGETYSELEECMESMDEVLEGGTQYEDIIPQTKDYIDTKEERVKSLNDHIYKDKITGGYARLFCDYMSIAFGLYAVFIAAYVILRDKKNNFFEGIYSKGISSFEYVVGKYLAISVLMIGILCTIAVFYDISFMRMEALKGVDIMRFALFKYSIIWVVPTILFANALGMFTAIIFQNGLCSILVQIGVWFYSMSGLCSTFGLDKYLIRFNSSGRYSLFTSNWEKFILNRCFYIIAAFLLIGISSICFEWRRRKQYEGLSYRFRNKFSKAQHKG